MKLYYPLSLSAIFLIIGCTTKTEIQESQLNRQFSNGQTIFVKKTDEYSRMYGAVTGHLWNEQHSFKYRFSIEPDDIVWEGLMGESPKSILNCASGLYLKTITEQVLTDTLSQATTILHRPNYYQHIDERYFFKLLGNQYFVMVDSSLYQNKLSGCTQEYVPNP